MSKNIPLLLILVSLISCNESGLNISFGEIEGAYFQPKGKSIIIDSPNTLQDSMKFVWGGSVIKAGGKYHMFYSRWDTSGGNLTFSNAWVLNSEIAYAVSDLPDREFRYVATILQGRMHDGDSSAWDAQAVHNPHIKQFDETFYLYYIGNRDPGEQPEDKGGWALNKRNRCQQNQSTGVIAFKSFEDIISGNFIRPDDPLLLPRTRVREDKKNILFPSPEGTIAKPDNIIIVNPSVEFRKSDGKYLLYFKGNLYDPGWKGVHGVAISDSPTGPFVALDDLIFNIETDDGSIASAEDPFVWYHDKNNIFYAIIKDFTGKLTGSKPGLALLESEDGIKWIRSKGTVLLEKTLRFTNGEVLEVKNLERPQLLLDNRGNPIVLYAACSIEPVGQKIDGSTFNVQIPLVVGSD